MFLRTSELIPLYATEWIMLGLAGLAVTGFIAFLDALLVKLRWGAAPGTATRAVFAVIIAVSFLFGAWTWIATFQNAPVMPNSWRALLFAFVVTACVVAVRGWFQSELAAIAATARVLALAGSATLLSSPFVIRETPKAHVERPTDSTRAASKPNIVLISVDALAAAHLQPYGSLRPTSPNIAEFSSHAILFERFHANANFTTPGIASIMTGVEPWTHRALQLAGHAIGDSILESLPARLHEAGYQTAYFGSNPAAGARRQGFSAYFDHEDSNLEWNYGPCFDAMTPRLPYLCPAAWNPLIVVSYRAMVRTANAMGLLRLPPHSELEKMVARAARWVEDRGRGPVFMWVHFFPPHDPYAAPEPWLGRFDHSPGARSAHSNPAIASSSTSRLLFDMSLEPASRINTLEARYDESIAYVDHYIGQLITVIHQNLGPNTAILLTADHGESFDHGYGGHTGVMLYEDLIHIPLIIELPNPSATGERRSDLAAQIDLAPTIAAIAEVSPSPRWAGRSLLTHPDGSEPRTTFAMNFEQNASRGRLTTGSVAALSSNWKLVRFFGEPHYPNMPQLQSQLFDLVEDPHEHENSASMHTDVVAALSAQIDAQLAIHGSSLSK